MLASFQGDAEPFSRSDHDDLANATIDDEMCEAPDLKVLDATAAANCGISGNDYRQSYRVGPPLNFLDLVQAMGQTDCDRHLLPW